MIKQLSENDVYKYEISIKKCIDELLIQDDVREDLIKIEKERIYADMCKYISDKTAIIIGALDKDIIGFIWAYKRNDYNKERYHISYFIVSKNFQNMGIGTKLINHIYEMAYQNNVEEIELMVKETNTKAINFYKKHDFCVEQLKLCKKFLK